MVKKPTITIVGSGYVGLTTAAILANVGYKVFALDTDSKKIEIIKNGKAHFFESGLDQFVKKGIDSGNLIPTLSYKEAIPESDVVFSCVGTPDKNDGSSNLEYIFASAREAAKNAKNGMIYVQKSTVPVGTGREVIKKMCRANPKLEFSYVSNPEFLAEGSALFDSLNMDRVVIGSDDRAAANKVEKVFQDIIDFSKKLDHKKYADYARFYCDKAASKKAVPETAILLTALESAELVKVSSNAFLALKISFANNIAKLADAVGSDISEVMDGVGGDHRIDRSFFYAGLGWGGGCFPKDVSGLIAIAEKKGVDMPIMTAAVDVNTGMVEYVADKIKRSLKSRKRAVIAVLGLSFKPGTSDIRRSQSVKLANLLANRGHWVQAYDPKANGEAKPALDKSVQVFDSTYSAVAGAHCVVLATEWKDFITADWKKIKKLMKGKVVVDARNKLDEDELKKIGFTYEGVGR